MMTQDNGRDRKTVGFIIAAQKLEAMGLYPAYAKLALLRQGHRLETEDPQSLALEIFDRAEMEWKADDRDRVEAREFHGYDVPLPDLSDCDLNDVAADVDRLRGRLGQIRSRAREAGQRLMQLHLDPKASIDDVLEAQRAHDHLISAAEAGAIVLDRFRIQLGAATELHLRRREREEETAE